MDYVDKIRAMQAKRAIMAKAKAKAKNNVLPPPAQGYMVNPNTDYLSDPRETEFDPATELKYQMRDKLGMARGGKIPGTPPQNPMKDNKMVPMRSGEYVIPEPVVKAVGKPFFDNMIKKVTGRSPYGSPGRGFIGGGSGDSGWTPPEDINQNETNFGPGGNYNTNYEGSYYPADFMGADKGPKAPYIGYYGGKDDNPLYSWIPPEYRDFFAHHGGDWSDDGGGGRNWFSKHIPGGIQIGGGRGGGMWGSDVYSILDKKGHRGGGGGGPENWGDLGNLPKSNLSQRPGWSLNNMFSGLPEGFTEKNRFGGGAPIFPGSLDSGPGWGAGGNVFTSINQSNHPFQSLPGSFDQLGKGSSGYIPFYGRFTTQQMAKSLSRGRQPWDYWSGGRMKVSPLPLSQWGGGWKGGNASSKFGPNNRQLNQE